ncbi:unnamed protein product, partial [Allacma fusca]
AGGDETIHAKRNNSGLLEFCYQRVIMSRLGELLQMDCEPEEGSPTVSNDEELEEKLKSWVSLLKEQAGVALQISPSREEPYKNIYKALEATIPAQKKMVSVLKSYEGSPVLRFRLEFAIIHATSSLAKWYEICEEYGISEKYHKQCLGIIENALTNSKDDVEEEIQGGVRRCHFMHIYEHIRFAIVCSERDKQHEALELLMKAEELYHQFKTEETSVSLEHYPILGI